MPNNDLRSGAEPVTAVKRGDHQRPQNPNLTSTFISLPFSYLISMIQHIPGIDLTARFRRQYFGSFSLSPCKRFVTVGYAQRQLIVRDVRVEWPPAILPMPNPAPFTSFVESSIR